MGAARRRCLNVLLDRRGEMSGEADAIQDQAACDLGGLDFDDSMQLDLGACGRRLQLEAHAGLVQAGHDQGHAGEILDPDPNLANARIIGPTDQADLFLQQRHDGEMGSLDGLDQQRDVDLALDQHRLQRRREAFDDSKSHLRKAATDRLGQNDRELLREPRRQPDDDRPARLPLESQQIGLDLLGVSQQEDGPLEEQAGLVGCRGTASVALEELDPELLFEQSDLPAESRLGHMQNGRGFAVMLLCGQRDEIAELSEVHGDR